jgi:hypothetical protein
MAVFYPYPEHWPGIQVLFAGIALAGLTVLFWLGRRRYPFLIVGWLWFLGTFVPVIGLVQSGSQAMADRFTYVPSLGALILVVWGAPELFKPGRYRIIGLSAACSVALILCTVITRQQLGYWKNSETLFRHAIAVTTNNYIAHFNLGLALIPAGETNAGIAQIYKALAIAPRFKGRMQFADVLVDQGRIPEAMEQYRIILQQHPNLPPALNNLAWLLATDDDPKLRNGTEAVRLAERACDLTHYQAPAFVGTLAAAYAEAGRFDDAVKTEEMVITLANTARATKLSEKNRQLLELYRAGRPYHETTKLY